MKNLDRYVPVKHAERCPHCQIRYVNLEAHVVRKHGAAGSAGDDSVLSERERTVARLATDELMNISQIAAHTGLSEVLVRKALHIARRKGAPVPARLPRSPNKRGVSTAAMLAERERLIALRVVGINGRIARKLHLNENTVRLRLWKYDKRQREAARIKQGRPI